MQSRSAHPPEVRSIHEDGKRREQDVDFKDGECQDGENFSARSSGSTGSIIFSIALRADSGRKGISRDTKRKQDLNSRSSKTRIPTVSSPVEENTEKRLEEGDYFETNLVGLIPEDGFLQIYQELDTWSQTSTEIHSLNLNLTSPPQEVNQERISYSESNEESFDSGSLGVEDSSVSDHNIIQTPLKSQLSEPEPETISDPDLAELDEPHIPEKEEFVLPEIKQEEEEESQNFDINQNPEINPSVGTDPELTVQSLPGSKNYPEKNTFIEKVVEERSKPDILNQKSRPVQNQSPQHSRPIQNQNPQHSRPIQNQNPQQSRPIQNQNPRQSRPIQNQNPQQSRPIQNQNLQQSRPIQNQNPQHSRLIQNQNPQHSRPIQNQNPQQSRPIQNNNLNSSLGIKGPIGSSGARLPTGPTGPGKQSAVSDHITEPLNSRKYLK